MHFQLLGLAALGSLAAAAPAPSRTSELVERGSSCTFTSATQASASAKSCSNIVLKNIAVPAGETLDLSKAKDGATVRSTNCTIFSTRQIS